MQSFVHEMVWSQPNASLAISLTASGFRFRRLTANQRGGLVVSRWLLGAKVPSVWLCVWLRCLYLNDGFPDCQPRLLSRDGFYTVGFEFIKIM